MESAHIMWLENETGVELVKYIPKGKDVSENTPASDTERQNSQIPAQCGNSECVDEQPRNDDTVLAMIKRIAKDNTLDMSAKVARLRESVPFSVEHPVIALFRLFGRTLEGGGK